MIVIPGVSGDDTKECLRRLRECPADQDALIREVGQGIRRGTLELWRCCDLKGRVLIATVITAIKYDAGERVFEVRDVAKSPTYNGDIPFLPNLNTWALEAATDRACDWVEITSGNTHVLATVPKLVGPWELYSQTMRRKVNYGQ